MFNFNFISTNLYYQLSMYFVGAVARSSFEIAMPSDVTASASVGNAEDSLYNENTLPPTALIAEHVASCVQIHEDGGSPPVLECFFFFFFSLLCF